MKKLFQIALIGILTLSCNSKKKTESKTFKEAELELTNYSEEDRMKELEYLKTNVFNGPSSQLFEVCNQGCKELYRANPAL